MITDGREPRWTAGGASKLVTAVFRTLSEKAGELPVRPVNWMERLLRHVV
jgi:hypothetical protein